MQALALAKVVWQGSFSFANGEAWLDYVLIWEPSGFSTSWIHDESLGIDIVEIRISEGEEKIQKLTIKFERLALSDQHKRVWQ